MFAPTNRHNFFFNEAFHYSTVMNKDYQIFWPSPSDPVRFEVDTSHEKVESISESDTMNVSNLSQGIMLSDSPICMETTSTTCDLPQNEIKNFERENEYESTLCEDVYGTLDNLLNGKYLFVSNMQKRETFFCVFCDNNNSQVLC